MEFPCYYNLLAPVNFKLKIWLNFKEITTKEFQNYKEWIKNMNILSYCIQKHDIHKEIFCNKDFKIVKVKFMKKVC